MVSKNQVKKAGRRLSKDALNSEDIDIIREFRESHDDLLIQTSNDINEILSGNHILFLVSGRPKRLKSIIRKLRLHGGSMDVTNMVDLVGVRIIVGDMENQDRAMRVIEQEFPDVRIQDTRESSDHGYRSIHLRIRSEGKQIEVQIRSLPQHLWAIESESFGQIVKDGEGPKDIREYLDNQLKEVCKAIDDGQSIDGIPRGDLYSRRSPDSVLLPNLRRQFEQAVANIRSYRGDISYIVVFDKGTKAITCERLYYADQREAAVKKYSELSSWLDEDEYDVIILSSISKEAMSVTHSNFFRKVRFGKV